MDKSGFIVPPPGLIPSHVDDQTTPARTIEPASFPAFVPVAIGAPLSAPPLPVPPQNVLPQEQTLLPTAWRLAFADGQSIEATGSLILGRDPATVPARQHARLVPVTDQAKSVSKTHAIIDLEGGELSVTDLHSTNGVIVIEADGTETDLEPGGRATVRHGSRLLLGEFRIDITHE
ncbi:FHA domain-containing protein [Glaciibacter superstes]|uniref:FHA domain-containing protein n=1 Tax=Glaciibacter superstes TaxID=501023 RepID=UPI0003B52B47|nr:FHA domain-containing protein [Glaciibacter superstes]